MDETILWLGMYSQLLGFWFLFVLFLFYFIFLILLLLFPKTQDIKYRTVTYFWPKGILIFHSYTGKNGIYALLPTSRESLSFLNITILALLAYKNISHYHRFSSNGNNHLWEFQRIQVVEQLWSKKILIQVKDLLFIRNQM